MQANFYGTFFRFIRSLIRKIYPKYSVQIPNNSNGPVVYVSHHQNLFGPFVILLWFPKCLHTWIFNVFLNQATCYKQFVDYTFTERYRWNRTLAKICAYPISFFISKLLNSGKGIPVYRGSRKILQTFNLSVAALSKNESIVIFPDTDYSDNSANVKDMYDGFLYLEKFYYKETGEHLCFIPLYASKNKHLLISDTQIYFRDNKDFYEERNIVYQKIHANLNELAKKCGDI
jgi:1-acyl-sn-glycerol-3-phosphate acyltransferase